MMEVKNNVALKDFNSLGVESTARSLAVVENEFDLLAIVENPAWRGAPKFALGGGSNVVLENRVEALVLKVELKGRRLLSESDSSWLVEAEAGEPWHEFVEWTLDQGYPGLENLALIPGTVGAAPVQNIGAYGVELKDRFESLDAMDLETGRISSLNAEACLFGYRDSIFKRGGPEGLGGRALILRARFRLPKKWVPVLGYADIERERIRAGGSDPTPKGVFGWICGIRRSKLPDPKEFGNAGSFFKNPAVSKSRCEELLAREPGLVHYPMPDGSAKLAAGWLLEACGWKGKALGRAGVYENHALVLVNLGGASGAEVLALAWAIQESVRERFGVELEMEPSLVK